MRTKKESIFLAQFINLPIRSISKRVSTEFLHGKLNKEQSTFSEGNLNIVRLTQIEHTHFHFLQTNVAFYCFAGNDGFTCILSKLTGATTQDWLVSNSYSFFIRSLFRYSIGKWFSWDYEPKKKSFSFQFSVSAIEWLFSSFLCEKNSAIFRLDDWMLFKVIQHQWWSNPYGNS